MWWWVALPVVCVVRFLGGAWAPVDDCDEVFNYWEPLHFLSFGSGLRTWEYCPSFGLRSFLYVALHLPAVVVASFLGLPRHWAFLATRLSLCILSSALDVQLAKQVHSVMKKGRHNLAGFFYLLFVTLSPGMVRASSAMLPSSLAMMCLTASTTCWLRAGVAAQQASAALQRGKPVKEPSPEQNLLMRGVLLAGVSVWWGWPFSVLCFAPLAVHVLRRVPFRTAAMHALLVSALLLAPVVVLDRFLYGRWLVSPINLLLYNVTSSTEAGSALFGVEPWHFYLRNLALNFHVVLPLALITAPVVWALDQNRRALLWPVAAPFLLWVLFFTAQAHKEERFIYPVYGCLCLCAAWSLSLLVPARHGKWAALVLAAFLLVMFLARQAALHRNYGAPTRLLLAANRGHLWKGGPDPETGHFNLCVGKEWYRFQSSFFLAENTRLRFIKSGFDGLLPHSFPEAPVGAAADARTPWLASLEGASQQCPLGTNNLNRGDPSLFVPLEACHGVLDSEIPSQQEAPLDPTKWQRVATDRLMLPDQCRSFSRHLYVPLVTGDDDSCFVDISLFVPWTEEAEAEGSPP